MRRHLSTTSGVQRLAYGVAAGALTAGIGRFFGLGGMALGLLGWCGGVAVYLALAWWLARSFDAQQVRRRARALDQPGLLILASMLVVVGISVVAIALLLQQVRQMDGPARAAHIALALVALAGSWLMIHTIYAFHYAHSYYQDEGMARPAGLAFPGRDEPDYTDFLYHALVIGMTSQVSDVQVVSRGMRRICMVHGVLAFGFNMLVLALSINVVAGAMQ